MTVIDGNALAREVEEHLRRVVERRGDISTLLVLQVGHHPASEQFVEKKRRLAERIGIPFLLQKHPREISESALIDDIHRSAADPTIGGIVLQLPLPVSMNTATILEAIPKEKDIDMLSRATMADFREEKTRILPPVVAAIHHILEHEDISSSGLDVLVIGKGRLVGTPAALWFTQEGAHVTQVERDIRELRELAREADVIVGGAGSPGLITPDMIRPGVILLDAATSEADGKLVGDIDPRCAEHARVYTPVPGGIGPLTVVMLMKNLLILDRAKIKNQK